MLKQLFLKTHEYYESLAELVERGHVNVADSRQRSIVQ